MKIIGGGGHAKVCIEVLQLAGAYPLSERFFFVAVGDNSDRKHEAMRNNLLWACPAIVHPSAIISRSAVIGDGSIVMAGAVVQAGAFIGKHVIINTGATVDHDCIIDDFAHIAPGAHLCGNVQVGEGALVGVGVAVAPGGKIPAWSVAKTRRLEIEQQESVSGNEELRGSALPVHGGEIRSSSK